MDPLALPEVTECSEEGYADLSLKLETIQRSLDGVCRLVARGVHRGTRVGFAVSLPPDWELQVLEDSKIPLYWGRTEIVSLGSESDAFLRTLDEVYGTNLNPQRMQEEVSYIAVSLEGDPTQVESSAVKLKLFFESEVEDREADFYLNIDATASSVQFREKDTDYRRGVVLSLLRS